jgi:hypothetical protein|tara:strand:+ start:395 stop:598 length:204 start_codon:yes stop_codon:yes gene_type:complete
MSADLERYTAIAARILELQKQLIALQDNLSHSYDDENFTVGAVATVKREIKHQQLLLDKISKSLEFK